jgi:hypothetical protein
MFVETTALSETLGQCMSASKWESSGNRVGIEWHIAVFNVHRTDALPSENIAFLTPESSLNIFTGPIPKLALSK